MECHEGLLSGKGDGIRQKMVRGGEEMESELGELAFAWTKDLW